MGSELGYILCSLGKLGTVIVRACLARALVGPAGSMNVVMLSYVFGNAFME